MGNIWRRIKRKFSRRNDSDDEPGVDPQRVSRNLLDTGLKTIKIVLIGEAGTGKTCLITNYQTNTFDERHVPNVLDVYRGKVTIKDI